MTDTPGGAIPLAQAIEEYLDWQALSKGRSPNPVRAYKQDLALFLAHSADVGVSSLDGVDRELLRGFQSDLARGPQRATPLSAATRHRRLAALRSFLKFCAREQWTPGDLGVSIDLPKLPRRLPKLLQDDELARMTADAAQGVELDQAGWRDRALVAFLICTGCRISEALALDRSDWNRHTVIVRGKGDIDRSVVITDRARAEVDRYLDARTDNTAALFVSHSPAEPADASASAAPRPSATASATATRSPNSTRTASGTLPTPSSKKNSATPASPPTTSATTASGRSSATPKSAGPAAPKPAKPSDDAACKSPGSSLMRRLWSLAK